MTTDFDLSLDNSPLLQSIHQLDFVQVKGEFPCPQSWRCPEQMLLLEAVGVTL